MRSCLRRGALAVLVCAALAGCGNRETQQALKSARTLADQKQYEDANDVLVEALRMRENEVRAQLPAPTDQSGIDDLTKKVQSDPEILKMERAQVPLYLHMQRPDLASAVYSDILSGDPGDTAVFDTLQDPDPAIRLGAVRVLDLAGHPAVIPPLIGATKDENQDVRRAAVGALGTVKDPQVVPPLIDALKDSYWFVRSDAANALGRENDARAVDPLFGAMNDSDKTVQGSAQTALITLATSKKVSADAYAAHLNDANTEVKTVAAVALAVKQDARATPVLLKLAASTDVATRLNAVKGLGETGDPAVAPTLRGLLHDPDVNVKGWSIIGLAKVKDQAALPDLKAIGADANEPQSIRDAANAAVGRITGTDAMSGPGGADDTGAGASGAAP